MKTLKKIIAIILAGIIVSGLCVLFTMAMASLPDERYVLVCMAIIALLLWS